MVQNLSGQTQSQFGTINRVGMTKEGRAVYQVTSADGHQAVNVSIPAQDCDRFEKAYNDMMTSAPKVEEYMRKYSNPEEVKKLRKKTAWTIAIPTLIGGLTPAIAIHKMKLGWKIAITALGTVAGFFAGTKIATKMNSPEGVKEFEAATQSLSTIDVQPLQ